MTQPKELHPSTAELLRYFEYDHLPKGPLRSASMLFHELAQTVAYDTPGGAELTTGLRKLLEAKDCIVRANLPRVSALVARAPEDLVE